MQHGCAVRVLGPLCLRQPLLQQGRVPCQLVALGFFGLVALPVPDQVWRQHAPACGVQLANQVGPQQAVAGIAVQQQYGGALERLQRKWQWEQEKSVALLTRKPAAKREAA